MKSAYERAGVSIDAGNESTRRIKKHVKDTHNKDVLANIGSFGGLFRFDKKRFKDPVLVASTDGVGTKLKLAYWTGRHDTVGQDLVNHCVNDILVQGAKPLFFLDYFGTSKLDPGSFEMLVKGLAKACKENDCALLGGETAELPGLYRKDEYDLASCIVGAVEKSRLITGKSIKEGDRIIGLPSSGLHTNGYSLALKSLDAKKNLKRRYRGVGILKNSLMKIHKSYLKPVSKVLDRVDVKGMAHITGGGLIENIPRILPKDLDASIKKGSWNVQQIFRLIQKKGKVAEEEMHRVFNMGIGYVLIVAKKDTHKTMSLLAKERPRLIGEIVKGEGRAVLH